MCTAQNAQIVEQVIADFTSQNKPFTAYDITREARNRGADEHHYHLKSAVHSLYSYLQSINWERTLITIPGVAVNPWLYHPDGYDTDDYINQGTNITVVDIQDDPATDDPDSPDSPDSQDDSVDSTDSSSGVYVLTAQKVKVTSDQRLSIPMSMLISLKWLGAYTLINLFIESNGTSREIYRIVEDDPATSYTTLVLKRSYNINSDGRLRIHNKYLGNKSQYMVAVDGDSICIEAC